MRKVIDAGEASAALVDALANMLHVHDGDEFALGQFMYEALASARAHYEAEVAGEDDVIVEVIDRERSNA